MKRVKVVVLVFVFLISALSFADETTGALDRAKGLYQSGKYSESIGELNYAINQIQQIIMERYKTVFPAALSGWQADEFNADAASMALLGGGISVSRNYSKELEQESNDYYTETASINISLVSDSPMLSSLMMMFNNPMFLGGNKMVTIQGEKAIESSDSDGVPNELQFVIANRVIITVSASSCTKDDLYAYANKIDFAKLKTLMN
ncbi:MAG TPA: hypothetical protein PLD62_03495 [Candidatus Cloacimonadota bacterium]|nr:hypothetical protein [Candidatus Cloacimonadota bacterium]